MKHLLTAFAVALILFTVQAAMGQVQSEIALTRTQIQTERQAIVAQNLPLTDDEAKLFWPAYRAYREEMSKLGDRFVALTEEYAKNYDTMTDPQATAMIEEFLTIQKKEIETKKSWVPKFAKIVPAKSVARFFQIENRLDLIVRSDVAALIPLVGQEK